MYHVELRQFPHNFCRFNLTERDLRETILETLAHGEWIELGERKWNPHQASLTVLEGPQLPVEQLSMGRGWRNAVRQGSDVTEQLLVTVRAEADTPIRVPPSGAGGPSKSIPAGRQRSLAEPGGAPGTERDDVAIDVRPASDSLGLEVLARLATEPVPLAIAWQLARERFPELAASECLKLAEHAIHSLVQARLAIVLVSSVTGEQEPCETPEQVQQALLAIGSWSGAGSALTSLRKA